LLPSIANPHAAIRNPQFKTLLMPGGLGSTHKVLILAKGIVVLGIIILLQAGQVSFGHAMFFAAGSYTAGFWGRYLGVGDLFAYLVVGTVVATLLGLLVGLFVVRYREIFFGMLNLAFSMVLWSLLEKMFHLTNGADGMRVPRPTVFGMAFSPDNFQYVLLYLTLAIATAATFAVQRFLESPTGNMLRAIKSNETRLEYLGVSARRVLLIGYVYADARRRGMNAVLWTLLAIFIPSAIGIILYFILRDPLAVPCPGCGTPARKGHAFCASCGAAVRRACPQCRQPVEAAWRNCPSCGAPLGASAAPGPANA